MVDPFCSGLNFYSLQYILCYETPLKAYVLTCILYYTDIVKGTALSEEKMGPLSELSFFLSPFSLEFFPCPVKAAVTNFRQASY